MLSEQRSARDKRKEFRAALASGRLLRFPGAFAPLVCLLIEEIGFEGIYISGAVLANELGLPDVGLTTLSEVAARGHAMARVTNLPTIIDVDTGFGEPIHVARTVTMMEDMGICGCHLEDQLNPKRCGHLDHKQLVEPEVMMRKVKAAVDARRDTNFVVIARTDARAEEGVEGAIARAQRYVDMGADMIFPEALQNEAEFDQFRKAMAVPLLANMTEFSKSPLLTTSRLEELGYNVVIYPVTSLRLAMKAVEDGLRAIDAAGSQQALVDSMQTRKRLYELLRYEAYSQFDERIFDFEAGDP